MSIKKMFAFFILALLILGVYWSWPLLASLPEAMPARPQPLPTAVIPEPDAPYVPVEYPTMPPELISPTPPPLPTAVATNTPTSVIVIDPAALPPTAVPSPIPTVDWAPKIKAANDHLKATVAILNTCIHEAQVKGLQIPPVFVDCTAPATAVQQAKTNFETLQKAIEEYNKGS